ncbi:carbonic anhydrase [Corynebacterium caspium]|uniref:carbonic anhydrase n=1 Tax=Corynebacterium caspium TaxID=234828 RepID=UPI0003632C83|nr:carbonic anhydrase [Corynebacterium caspium]WKD58707.1 Carbonic anhydrase [Corynebacterium caspium DSM 44850]
MPFRDVEPNHPQQVWEILKGGNFRFCSSRNKHTHIDIGRRLSLHSRQNPRAVVFACSDSRVPVELIFDVGLGDIFVVRTAGEILDPAVLGSLEYAIESLNIDLVVVMGHDNCGAVAAAQEALDNNDVPDGWRRTLIEKVTPSIMIARKRGETTTEGYERIHVSETIDQLYQRLPTLKQRIAEGTCGLVGLRYLLHSGRVEVLNAHGIKP